MNQALERTFRPEFLNRIDEIIIFHPLTKEEIIQVVGLMVEDIRHRLAERGITFGSTPAASTWVAKEGFDPVYGARPLRPAIQCHLENALSKSIISGKFQPGGHILVDAGDAGLVLNQAKALAVVA